MTVPTPNYAHKATFLKGHDGDSFWLSTDFGLNTAGVRMILPTYLRLYGIDTWEIPPIAASPFDPGHLLGFQATEFTNSHLLRGPIVVQTLKPTGVSVGEEKYGRWLARVWVGDDELSDLLRSNGFEKRLS
jgi:endonuclease YncB( thermonuclease family)